MSDEDVTFVERLVRAFEQADDSPVCKLFREVGGVINDVCFYLNAQGYRTEKKLNSCGAFLEISNAHGTQALFCWRLYEEDKIKLDVVTGYLSRQEIVSNDIEEIKEAILKWFKTGLLLSI